MPRPSRSRFRRGVGRTFSPGRDVRGPVQSTLDGTTATRTATAAPDEEEDDRTAAERRASRARRRSLTRGGRIQSEGVAALRDFDPRDFLGADALQAVFDEATISNFLPQLRGLQARNARRGVRGPLAGALEGDLASGFQRNLLATAGRFGSQAANLEVGRGQALAEIGGTERAQGLSLLGTELELELAREQARRAREGRRKSALGTGIGGAIGAAAGSLIPGIGTGIGAAVGSSLGGGASTFF